MHALKTLYFAGVVLDARFSVLSLFFVFTSLRARSRPPQFCWESRFGFRWSGEHRTITAEERKHGPNEAHGDPIF